MGQGVEKHVASGRFFFSDLWELAEVNINKRELQVLPQR